MRSNSSTRYMRRLEHVLDNLPHAIAAVQTDGVILFCNREFTELSGLNSHREVIGKTIQSVVLYENDVKQMIADIEAATQNGPISRPAKVRRTIRTFNGTLFEAEITFSNYFEFSKSIVVAQIEDISERIGAETALRESEEKLRALFENSPIGLTHNRLLCDQNGSPVDYLYLDANEQYMKLVGIDPRGKKAGEVLPAVLEDAPLLIRTYGEVALSGVPLRFERQLPVNDRWADFVVFRSMPDHFVVAFLDITEQKRAEQELQKARNYISNIIDSMPSTLIGVDAQGKVTQWNHEAQNMSGIDAEKALGQPLELVFPGMATEIDKIQSAMRKKEVYSERRRIAGADGKSRFEEVTVYPLIANGVDGAVIRLDDISERVRLEEMMLQSEKMLSVGGLASGMAHEINNPLGGMIQTAYVMKERLTNLELPANVAAAIEAGLTMEALAAFMEKRKILDMIERICKSGSRAAEIVQNMLSFARKADASNSSHDVRDLLDRCVELAGIDYDLKKQYDFRRIEILREYAEDLPLVPCESGKIQQVFLNILRNGAEAMQQPAQGGEKMPAPRFYLRLRYEREAAMVRIEIEDNGPGMDEEVRRRIFEPFFTTKPPDRGTGLGLSVSYFIICDNHKGEIGVSSEPGKGTRFVIRLPLRRKPA
ncbi:MAG: PAS domain-containing sensor histidine kinase [Syntrophobacteraceae bacterium]